MLTKQQLNRAMYPPTEDDITNKVLELNQITGRQFSINFKGRDGKPMIMEGDKTLHIKNNKRELFVFLDDTVELAKKGDSRTLEKIKNWHQGY